MSKNDWQCCYSEVNTGHQKFNITAETPAVSAFLQLLQGLFIILKACKLVGELSLRWTILGLLRETEILEEPYAAWGAHWEECRDIGFFPTAVWVTRHRIYWCLILYLPIRLLILKINSMFMALRQTSVWTKIVYYIRIRQIQNLSPSVTCTSTWRQFEAWLRSGLSQFLYQSKVTQ